MTNEAINVFVCRAHLHNKSDNMTAITDNLVRKYLDQGGAVTKLPDYDSSSASNVKDKYLNRAFMDKKGWGDKRFTVVTLFFRQAGKGYSMPYYRLSNFEEISASVFTKRINSGRYVDIKKTEEKVQIEEPVKQIKPVERKRTTTELPRHIKAILGIN